MRRRADRQLRAGALLDGDMKKIRLIDLSPTHVGAFREAASLSGEHRLDLSYDVYEFEAGREGYVGGPLPSDQGSPRAHDHIECFLSIPLAWLDFRVLTLPFSDVEKLREVIPYELDSLIMGGSERVVFDVAAVTPSAGGSFDVLVAFVGKDILKTVLDVLCNRGIDPRVVTSLGLRAALSSSTGSVVERLTKPSPLEQSEKIETAKQELSSPLINLRRADLSYTKDTQKRERTLRVTALLLISLALALHAYLAATIILGKRDIAAARMSAQQRYATLFPSQRKITDEVYQMKAQVKAVKDRAEVFTGADPLGLLRIISQNTPKGVQVNEIVAARDLVTIKAEAPSAAEADRMKSALAESLTAVSVSETKPLSGGKTLFSITARGVR